MTSLHKYFEQKLKKTKYGEWGAETECSECGLTPS